MVPASIHVFVCLFTVTIKNLPPNADKKRMFQVKENLKKQTRPGLCYKEISCAFTEASAPGMSNKSSVLHNNIHVPVH